MFEVGSMSMIFWRVLNRALADSVASSSDPGTTTALPFPALTQPAKTLKQSITIEG